MWLIPLLKLESYWQLQEAKEAVVVHTEWAKKATVQEPLRRLQACPKLKKLMHQLMLQEKDLDYTKNAYLAWP